MKIYARELLKQVNEQIQGGAISMTKNNARFEGRQDNEEPKNGTRRSNTGISAFLLVVEY